LYSLEPLNESWQCILAICCSLKAPMTLCVKIYHWLLVNKGAPSDKALSRFHTFIVAQQKVIGSLLISTLQSIFDLSFLLICLLFWMKLDFFLLWNWHFWGYLKKNNTKKTLSKLLRVKISNKFILFPPRISPRCLSIWFVLVFCCRYWTQQL
jgi:hypothetical protein